MTPGANGSHVALWATAGLLLVVGLVAFWYLDTQHVNADAGRLRRLRDASLQDSHSGVAETSDWPQWRGPARDGIAPGTRFLTSWPPAGPPVLWRATCGLGYSSLAVAAQQVFTIFQEGDDEAAICWDADTGR